MTHQEPPATENPSVLAGHTIDGPASARFSIDGRLYTNFTGCGYLALSRVPEIRDAVKIAIDRGTPFAQQLPAAKGAIDPIFDEVENAASSAAGTESSVYFASGYAIGAVGLASLDAPYDLLFIDENAHYNLKDAARALALPCFPFEHCNAGALRDLLRTNVHAKRRPLVVTDGAFPISGRVPPLSDYAIELQPYDGRLFVDEAHSFGVVGEQGRGAVEYCGVEPIAIIGATFSKAYCAQGAFVGCSLAAAKRLRSYPVIRGACAGSPLSAVAATASLRYVSQHPEIRVELRQLTQYLRNGLRSIGIDVIDSPAPIVSFRCGTWADMQSLQRRAFDNGVIINHSTYVGAVAGGTIVCAVFRDHSTEDIDLLLDALRRHHS